MDRFLGISRKMKYDGGSPAGSNLAPLPCPQPAGSSSQLSASPRALYHLNYFSVTRGCSSGVAHP